MDTYVEIAVDVLRRSRRPLGPKAILATAYRDGLVPQHLHGKTQHKTLQARLSEDILSRRDRSPFFRTAPGMFFLREFLSEPSVPEEFRHPIATRRRVRDLLKGPALAIDAKILNEIGSTNCRLEKHSILTLLHENQFRYDDPKHHDPSSVFIWSFVLVTREEEVLSYRLGRYRDNRDAFMLRRSVGFSTLVNLDDRTLFNMVDFGILDSGVAATKTDLDIPEMPNNLQSTINPSSIEYFLRIPNAVGQDELVAVVNYSCPEWFEPTKRRLAMHDLNWLDLSTPPNDLNDFDPWSQSIIRERDSVQPRV